MLKNGLHLLDFIFNLTSIAKLTRDLICSVNFFPNFCVLEELYSGKVIGIGRELEGLYLLKSLIKAVAGITVGNNNSSTLWHLRLGHPAPGVVKHISSIDASILEKVPICHICPQAKQSRPSFHNSKYNSSDNF